MDIKKNISIKDVAEEAGVSITTVSRVLNNPKKVKESTYKKVTNAIKDLKYESSSLNTRFDKDRSKLVAVFLPTINCECFNEISRGILEELEKNDIDSFIWNANESTYTESRVLSALSQIQVQGAIFILSCVEDFPLEGITAEMPIVAIERTVQENEDVDVILVDAEMGMDLMVGYLYEQGHRNIGLLCGDISSSTSTSKTQAYKKALLKRELNWDASKVISSGWTTICGYDGIKQLLSMHNDVTAVICLSDELAIGAINAASEMGYNCPGDISITGFDNTPSGAVNYPKLTTLSYQHYAMGQLAAKSIIQRINNPKTKTKKTIFPMELIKRDTTGIMKK